MDSEPGDARVPFGVGGLNRVASLGYLQRMFTRTSLLVLLGGGRAALTACASGSKYQGLDAAGVYRLAQEEYESGDYGDAAETLDRLLLVYPTFEQAAEAYFLMAEAYFLDEQYITSSSEYTRFLDLYPAHPNAPSAALGVCRSYAALSPIPQRDQTFTEQALTVCRNVVGDYQGRSEAQEAAGIANEMRDKLARKAFEGGSYYLRRDFFDSAIIYFEDVVEAYPDTEWAPRALAGIIEAYGEIGYDEEVELARNRLLTEYPDSPEARALGQATSGGRPDTSGS
jgi:outer membrane protein assembly factor BamD